MYNTAYGVRVISIHTLYFHGVVLNVAHFDGLCHTVKYSVLAILGMWFPALDESLKIKLKKNLISVVF